MRIRSYGADHKKPGEATRIVEDSDFVHRPVRVKNSTSVKRWVVGKRRVEVVMCPEEVISFLLTLSPDCIAEAVTQVDEELLAGIPEVLKQLAAGAINTRSAAVNL